MTETQARRMLDWLCTHFGIYSINLEWCNYVIEGHAHFNRRSIQLGNRTRFGVEPTMCHEFAHYLANVRSARAGDGWVEDHGREFTAALLDITTVWYGGYQHYPWEKEYASVRKFLGETKI